MVCPSKLEARCLTSDFNVLKKNTKCNPFLLMCPCMWITRHTSHDQEYSTRLLENVVNESAFVPMRGDGLNESSTVISRLDDR